MTMISRSKQSGMTLLEMMVAVGIIGVLSAIAVPIYRDYVTTAQQSVLSDNIESIRLFQEERRLSEGAYVGGTYNPASPDASGGLKEVLGWSPRVSVDQVTYVVDNVTSSGFRVTATHQDGTSVQKSF